MEDRVKAFSDNAAFYKQSNDFTAKFADHALTLVPPLDANSIVYDNASGLGVVSFAVASKFSDPSAMPRIHGTDLAQGMVDMMKSQIVAKGLQEKISAQVVDGRDLEPFADKTFTHSFTNFAIMMEDAEAVKVAREIRHTLKPGGTACVLTWQRAGTELMDAVCRRIRPNEELLQVIPPRWNTKEKLVDTLKAGGFADGDIDVHLKEDT